MDIVDLSIAGFNIRVKLIDTETVLPKIFFKHNIELYLKEFVVNQHHRHIDYYIIVTWDTEQSIVNKKNTNKFFINYYVQKSDKVVETYYQISYYQFNAVLQNIIYKLVTKEGGLILHASASDINGANIFMGKSGAGKSTISILLEGEFPKLADDAVIIRKEKNSYYFYQTPFLEKNYVIKKTLKYHLKRIYFLKKSRRFHISQIDDYNVILQSLLEESYYIQDYNKHIQLLTKFIREFKSFYKISFAKEDKGLIDFMRSAHDEK